MDIHGKNPISERIFFEVKSENVAVFYLTGIVDLFNTHPIRNYISGEIETGNYAKVVLNFRKVKYLDSSSIAGFLKIKNQFKGKTNFRFCEMNTIVRKIFRFMNMDSFLDIDDTEDESLVRITAPAAC